ALLHPGKRLTPLALRAVTVGATAVGNERVGALRVLAARDKAAKRGSAAGLNCAWLTRPRLASSQEGPKGGPVDKEVDRGRWSDAEVASQGARPPSALNWARQPT